MASVSTWSGIRNKLENDYLCPALRGHIQYFATSYSKSADHEGRAAIRTPSLSNGSILCFIIGLNCCCKEIPNNSCKIQNQIVHIKAALNDWLYHFYANVPSILNF